MFCHIREKEDVIFITMLYAVDKIKRENINEALRDDMT